jgi:hypothetical protein
MISGPYSTGAKTRSDREQNLHSLNRAAYEVFRRGHVPIVGVNLALPIIWAVGGDATDEVMMPLSLAAADRCDAVLRIGGASKGADQEVERIQARGGKVYTSVEEVPGRDSEGS